LPPNATKVLTNFKSCDNINKLFARLAQLVEHMLDVHGVTGSSPVPRTRIKVVIVDNLDFFIFACDFAGRMTKSIYFAPHLCYDTQKYMIKREKAEMLRDGNVQFSVFVLKRKWTKWIK
jgi:hypothetical protein